MGKVIDKGVMKAAEIIKEPALAQPEKESPRIAQVNINGKVVEAREGQTILQAAQDFNIYIPSLCYLEGIHQFGGCRMCMVEVEGMRNLVASCMVKVKDGMVVRTNTAKVRQARKINCELLLSDHPQDCLSCERSGQCELQTLARTLGITQARFGGSSLPGLLTYHHPLPGIPASAFFAAAASVFATRCRVSACLTRRDAASTPSSALRAACPSARWTAPTAGSA